MTSNHTETCTAIRPGYDDEGACDCGYLDSVMREGYQQDYSTPPPAERCPVCGHVSQHPDELHVCRDPKADELPKSAEPARYVCNCGAGFHEPEERTMHMASCPLKAEPAAPVCTACENGKCGGNFGCIKLDACASRKPAKAPQSDGTLDSLTGQMRPERSEYNRMSKAYDELQALLRADELRVREYADEVGRLKSAIAYAIEKSYPVMAERIQEIARGEG